MMHIIIGSALAQREGSGNAIGGYPQVSEKFSLSELIP